MSIPLLASDLLSQFDGVSHAFSSRLGGVSAGLFASLNCSPFAKDDAVAVAENRRRVATALNASQLVSNQQMHGNAVRVIANGDDLQAMPPADGLVTKLPGIAIAALAADCAPVLFADIANAVIGVAHVGWQGALSGVTDSVLAVMRLQGAEIEHIYCAIGPAIQLASYEVGAAFQTAFVARSPIDSSGFFSIGAATGNVHFDLGGYITARLLAAGVKQVDCSKQDTYADSDRFFSYRRGCHLRQPVYGRQSGAIALTGAV